MSTLKKILDASKKENRKIERKYRKNNQMIRLIAKQKGIKNWETADPIELLEKIVFTTL